MTRLTAIEKELAVYELHKAIQRCGEVGESEAILGYDENARLYQELVADLRIARAWIAQRL